MYDGLMINPLREYDGHIKEFTQNLKTFEDFMSVF